MTPPNLTYEQLHRNRAWAYGQLPDRQLAEALDGMPSGRAVDLGGGQGRHALYLRSLGFEVELVDLSEEALAQARRSAGEMQVDLETVRSNITLYEPPPNLRVVVAALLFHVPARHASLKAATRLGDAMLPGGLLYLSLPGFDETTAELAGQILETAGCASVRIEKHVVTRQERPRLPVPRRNETRAVGFRS